MTQQEVNKRWKDGKGYNTQPLMSRAISKYGWGNIIHELLCDNLTLKEASAMEKELISKHKSNDKEYGYNVTSGGDNGYGWKHTEESKAKMKLCHAGKELSANHKLKISERAKARGKTKEHIANNAKARQKPVYQINKDTNEIIKRWDGGKSASLSLIIQRSDICNCCKGNKKSAGGFIWQYA